MGEYQFSNFLQRADISRELARGLQCCPESGYRQGVSSWTAVLSRELGLDHLIEGPGLGLGLEG